MLRFTFVWVLRFALFPLLLGVALLGFGWWGVHAWRWNEADQGGAFVAAVWSFGAEPYWLCFAAGATLILWAWTRGYRIQHAKRERIGFGELAMANIVPLHLVVFALIALAVLP